MKGMLPMNVLVVLILVLVMTGVLFAGEKKIQNSLNENVRVNTCKTSIVKAETTKQILFNGGEPQAYIDCEKGTLDLKYNDIVQNDKLNQHLLDMKIAESLRQAWVATGEGKRSPFSDWNKDEDHEYKTLCILWDTVQFDDKLKEFAKKNPITFSFSTLRTLTRPNSDMTYAAALFGDNEFPPNLQGKISTIDDGTVILAKDYIGDLLNTVLGIRYTHSIAHIAGGCTDCQSAWSLDIISSSQSYSDIDQGVTDNDGRTYRLCDQIKN